MNDLLVRQLDLAFNQRSWHGTNLMGSLRGLRGEVLVWRPQPGRNNIAELAVHAAYWKYRAYRLITDEEPRSFELAGADFFDRNDEPSPAEWKADLELLRAWHDRFRSAAAALDAAALGRVVREHFTAADVICGAAAHDLYHAGQIQLVKRLYQHRPTPRSRS